MEKPLLSMGEGAYLRVARGGIEPPTHGFQDHVHLVVK